MKNIIRGQYDLWRPLLHIEESTIVISVPSQLTSFVARLAYQKWAASDPTAPLPYDGDTQNHPRH